MHFWDANVDVRLDVLIIPAINKWLNQPLYDLSFS